MTRHAESLCPEHGFVEALVHDECPLCGRTTKSVEVGHDRYETIAEGTPGDCRDERVRADCAVRSAACPSDEYRLFTKADWCFREGRPEPPEDHPYRKAWEAAHPAAAHRTKG